MFKVGDRVRMKDNAFFAYKTGCSDKCKKCPMHKREIYKIRKIEMHDVQWIWIEGPKLRCKLYSLNLSWYCTNFESANNWIEL